MKKTNSHQFLGIFLSGFFIPVLLLIFGVSLVVFSALKQEEDFSTLTQSQSKDILFYGQIGELLKGEKIQGEFKAIQDNLGAIALRFNTFNRLNSDILIFRIKEKWQKEWYDISEYPTSQFKSYQFFLFTFPKIANSQNKIYQFEIESKEGRANNAVGISEYLPIFQAKYFFNQQEIFASKKNLASFIFKKIRNAMLERDFVFFYLIFFLPSVFYYFWLFLAKRNLRQNYLLLFLALIGVLLDIFFIKRHSYLSTLLLITLIILAFKFHQVSLQKIAKFLFTSLFVLFSLATLFNFQYIAGKTGIWLYFLLLIYFVFEVLPKFLNALH